MAALLTDLFVVSPSILAASRGYRTYTVIDASACWRRDALMITSLRLLQAGVTPINIASVIAELHFGKGGSASEEIEYIFGVRDAMYGMSGNITAALCAKPLFPTG